METVDKPFCLEPSHTAIVVLDMQVKNFWDGTDGVSAAMLTRMETFFAALRQTAEAPEVFWVEHVGASATLPRLKNALGAQAKQRVVRKTGYSALRENSCILGGLLEEKWKEINRTITPSLVVMGMLNRSVDKQGGGFGFCVERTAYDALAQGYRVVVPQDAILDASRGFNSQTHHRCTSFSLGKFVCPSRCGMLHSLWCPSSMSECLGRLSAGRIEMPEAKENAVVHGPVGELLEVA